MGKQGGDFPLSNLLRETAGVPVAGDFVVLDALRGGDKSKIGGEFVLVFTLVDGFLALFDDSLHGFASFGFGGAAQKLKRVFETIDVASCLLKMFSECFLQLRFVRGVSHFG